MSIRSELENILNTFATNQVPRIAVAYEGKAFQKPTDNSPILQPVLIHNRIMDVTVDGKRQREFGLFQINIWFKNGQGRDKIETLARQLVALYPIVPKPSDPHAVYIYRTPQIESYGYDGDYCILPVTVYWKKEYPYV